MLLRGLSRMFLWTSPRLKISRSRCGLLGREGDLEAELAQLLHCPQAGLGASALVQVRRGRFAIVLLPLQQAVGDEQDAVADRDGGSPLPPADDEPPVLVRQRRAPRLLGARRAVGRLGQRAAQPLAALARLAALALACTRVVARANPRPRGEVGGGGEAVQVRADLREQ